MHLESLIMPSDVFDASRKRSLALPQFQVPEGRVGDLLAVPGHRVHAGRPHHRRGDRAVKQDLLNELFELVHRPLATSQRRSLRSTRTCRHTVSSANARHSLRGLLQLLRYEASAR